MFVCNIEIVFGFGFVFTNQVLTYEFLRKTINIPLDGYQSLSVKNFRKHLSLSLQFQRGDKAGYFRQRFHEES